MAERRMFAKTIVLSDAFLDLPMSARCLYFTLGMLADDDGFVNSPKSIMRQCGASEDDLRVLIGKKFLLVFDSGIIVIKHWRIHNYIQKDRYIKTKYQDELAMLALDENKAYTDSCIQNGYKVDTQVRLGKDRLGKVRLGKVSSNSAVRFTPPTVAEVKAYCDERGNNVDAERFVDFYESKGWMVGKNKMKSWKAAVRNWERDQNKAPAKKSDDDWDEIARMVDDE